VKVDNKRVTLIPYGPEREENPIMLKALKQHLLKIHRDERGAMSAEMLLIIAAIAIPIIVLLAIFKNKIIGWFRDQDSNLDTYKP